MKSAEPGLQMHTFYHFHMLSHSCQVTLAYQLAKRPTFAMLSDKVSCCLFLIVGSNYWGIFATACLCLIFSCKVEVRLDFIIFV